MHAPRNFKENHMTTWQNLIDFQTAHDQLHTDKTKDTPVTSENPDTSCTKCYPVKHTRGPRFRAAYGYFNKHFYVDTWTDNSKKEFEDTLENIEEFLQGKV